MKRKEDHSGSLRGGRLSSHYKEGLHGNGTAVIATCFESTDNVDVESPKVFWFEAR
jgi:hypothetical protein